MEKTTRDIIEKAYGSWDSNGSGVSYVRRIRDEAERREKKMGL